MDGPHRTETDPIGPGPPVVERRIGRGDLLGRYIVLEHRGAGAMGVVYTAYDPELDRRVALKVLHARHERTGRARERLVREARTLAKLSHPNVVSIHDRGEVDGQTFIAMEYVAGETLEAWLTSQRRSADEILGVYLQAGRGLAAAHAAGIVHRDFKPSNAIVSPSGQVRVLDFGLARALLPDDDAEQPESFASRFSTKVTVTGTLLGTPLYMAPERFGGRPADERSDQWSFCAALFEALYGRPAFAGDAVDDLVQRVTSGKVASVPNLRGVLGRVHRVLLRGLAQDPSARFPRMSDLLAALERARASRRPRVAAAALGVLLFGTLGAAIIARPEPGAACAGWEAKLVGVWDEDTRREVARAFASSGADERGDAQGRFAAAMDGWIHAWTAARQQVCEATHVRGEQSAMLLDLRMSCLDRQLDEADALSQSLRSQPSTTMVHRATEAALHLPVPADCRGALATAAGALLPADAEARRRIDDVRVRLDRVQALRNLGETQRAANAIGSVVAEAEHTQFAALTADARLLSARIRLDRGEMKAARADLLAAIDAGARAGDDALLATAWQRLVVVAIKRLRPEEADTLIPVAQAATARAAGDDRLRSDLSYALGQAWEHRDPVLARHHYREALRLATLAEGPRSLRVASALGRLGDLGRELGVLGEARAQLTATRDLLEALFGRFHTLLGVVTIQLGDVAAASGQADEAERLFAQGLEIQRRTDGPAGFRTLLALDNIGSALCNLGRHQAALRHYDELVRLVEELYGADSANAQNAVEARAICVKLAARPKRL